MRRLQHLSVMCTIRHFLLPGYDRKLVSICSRSQFFFRVTPNFVHNDHSSPPPPRPLFTCVLIKSNLHARGQQPTVISGIATTMGQESGERAPGDFGLDPFKLENNPAKKAKYELQEVKNGRLAMWAAAGMIMQGVTTDGGALNNLFVSFPFLGVVRAIVVKYWRRSVMLGCRCSLEVLFSLLSPPNIGAALESSAAYTPGWLVRD